MQKAEFNDYHVVQEEPLVIYFLLVAISTTKYDTYFITQWPPCTQSFLCYEACTDIMPAKNKSFLNSEHTQNNCKKAKCKTTFGTRDVQCPKLHYLTTYETSHAQWGIILLWWVIWLIIIENLHMHQEHCSFTSIKLVSVLECGTNSIVESFYYVNYGLSIIPSKIRQMISVTKT